MRRKGNRRKRPNKRFFVSWTNVFVSQFFPSFVSFFLSVCGKRNSFIALCNFVGRVIRPLFVNLLQLRRRTEFSYFWIMVSMANWFNIIHMMRVATATTKTRRQKIHFRQHFNAKSKHCESHMRNLIHLFIVYFSFLFRSATWSSKRHKVFRNVTLQAKMIVTRSRHLK